MSLCNNFKNLMNIETYSERFQTSMMDFFRKNSQLLKAVNCFHQKIIACFWQGAKYDYQRPHWVLHNKFWNVSKRNIDPRYNFYLRTGCERVEETSPSPFSHPQHFLCEIGSSNVAIREVALMRVYVQNLNRYLLTDST